MDASNFEFVRFNEAEYELGWRFDNVLTDEARRHSELLR